MVTPHAGVRIEMSCWKQKSPNQIVTPHAGVRIEMVSDLDTAAASPSPLTRGCELKWTHVEDIMQAERHPSRGGAN